MKREALRHPKTYDLSARLNCSLPEALGYLTLMWDFCGEMAPQGDIGKWSNGAIARACEFKGEPDLFVEALRGAKWLDPVEEHRLVVHDWPDHCEGFVRKKLERSKLNFLSYYGRTPDTKVHARNQKHKDTVQDNCIDTVQDNGPTIPSHPIPSNPIQTDGGCRDVGTKSEQIPEAPPPFAEGRLLYDPSMLPLPDVLETPKFRAAWADWCEYLVRKRVVIDQSGASAELARIARYGPTVAASMIEFAKRKQWKSLPEKPPPVDESPGGERRKPSEILRERQGKR